MPKYLSFCRPQKSLIVFKESNQIHSIINQITKINTSADSHEIEIVFSDLYFLSADGLILLVSFIKDLKSRGKDVIIKINTTPSDKKNYASRLDFFKNIELEYVESFNRHPNNGRFIEITHVPFGSYALSTNLEEKLQEGFELSDKEFKSIRLVLDELIANVTLHSKSLSGAFLYLQKYNKTKLDNSGKVESYSEIDLTVVDAGIGVRNSLSTAYPNIDNETALLNCIKFGTTSGNGRGHGLYIISELAIRTTGSFRIISHGNMLLKFNKFLNVNPYPFWNGTFLKWTFRLGERLDTNPIFTKIGYPLTGA